MVPIIFCDPTTITLLASAFHHCRPLLLSRPRSAMARAVVGFRRSSSNWGHALVDESVEPALDFSNLLTEHVSGGTVALAIALLLLFSLLRWRLAWDAAVKHRHVPKLTRSAGD